MAETGGRWEALSSASRGFKTYSWGTWTQCFNSIQILWVTCTLKHRKCQQTSVTGRSKNMYDICFEVLSAVIINSSVFWDIILCSPVKVNRRFDVTYRPNLQGRWVSQGWDQVKTGSKAEFCWNNLSVVELQLRKIQNIFSMLMIFVVVVSEVRSHTLRGRQTDRQTISIKLSLWSILQEWMNYLTNQPSN